MSSRWSVAEFSKMSMSMLTIFHASFSSILTNFSLNHVTSVTPTENGCPNTAISSLQSLILVDISSLMVSVGIIKASLRCFFPGGGYLCF